MQAEIAQMLFHRFEMGKIEKEIRGLLLLKERRALTKKSV